MKRSIDDVCTTRTASEREDFRTFRTTAQKQDETAQRLALMRSFQAGDGSGQPRNGADTMKPLSSFGSNLMAPYKGPIMAGRVVATRPDQSGKFLKLFVMVEQLYGGAFHPFVAYGPVSKDGCQDADLLPMVKFSAPNHALARPSGQGKQPNVFVVREGRLDFALYAGSLVEVFGGKKDGEDLKGVHVGCEVFVKNFHIGEKENNGKIYMNADGGVVIKPDVKGVWSAEKLQAYLVKSETTTTRLLRTILPAVGYLQQDWKASTKDVAELPQTKEVQNLIDLARAAVQDSLASTIASVRKEDPAIANDGGPSPFVLNYLSLLKALSSGSVDAIGEEIERVEQNGEAGERVLQAALQPLLASPPSGDAASKTAAVVAALQAESFQTTADRQLLRLWLAVAPYALFVCGKENELLSPVINQELCANSPPVVAMSVRLSRSLFDSNSLGNSGRPGNLITAHVHATIAVDPNAVSPDMEGIYNVACTAPSAASFKVKLSYFATTFSIKSDTLARITLEEIIPSAAMLLAVKVPRHSRDDDVETDWCAFNPIVDVIASIKAAGVEVSKECAVRRIGDASGGAAPKDPQVDDDKEARAEEGVLNATETAFCLASDQKCIRYIVVMHGLRDAKIKEGVSTFADGVDFEKQDRLVDELASSTEGVDSVYVQDGTARIGKMPSGERLSVVYAIAEEKLALFD